MRKFWKKQVEDLGGDASIIKSRSRIARHVVVAILEAHKEAITIRNAGYVVGRAAWKLTKPCVKLWNGIKDGFTSGQ